MILAPAALHLAAYQSVGLLEILGAPTGRFADLLGANHIAAANDHGFNDYASENESQVKSNGARREGLACELTLV